jgi:hypothetical protein
MDFTGTMFYRLAYYYPDLVVDLEPNLDVDDPTV